MARGSLTAIEKEIRKRSDKKDPNLTIGGGLKKRFVMNEQNFKVYEVDSEWVRNNLDVNFASGGHGRVHTFIPNNEVWIASQASSDYRAGTIMHEINEFKKMATLPYYHAHKNSQKFEHSDSKRRIALKKKIEIDEKGMVR